MPFMLAANTLIADRRSLVPNLGPAQHLWGYAGSENERRALRIAAERVSVEEETRSPRRSLPARLIGSGDDAVASGGPNVDNTREGLHGLCCGQRRRNVAGVYVRFREVNSCG